MNGAAQRSVARFALPRRTTHQLVELLGRRAIGIAWELRAVFVESARRQRGRERQSTKSIALALFSKRL
jgi:hypothetical protein